MPRMRRKDHKTRGRIRPLRKTAPAPVVIAKPDPAVDTIVESNPHTPGELLKAAAVLTDLERIDLAKKYLQQLVAVKPDEEALAEAGAQIEPATLMRLADNADLQPEGRQLADAVLAASAHVARDPARLRAEIDRLADPSRSVQRAALKRILAAHEDAVPALVLALADAKRVAVQPLLRQSLVAIGEQAVAPLTAALKTDNDALKLQIIDVLRQIGSRDAVAYLAAPATMEGNSPEVRDAARDALREIAGSQNPTVDDAAKLLAAEVAAYLKHDRLLKYAVDGRVAVWHWDANNGAPVRENISSDLAFPVIAARLAGDLIQLQPDDLLAKRLFLISTLEVAARRAGLDQPLGHDDPAVAEAAKLGPAAVEDALVSAMSNENFVAATAAAQMLGSIGDRKLLGSARGEFQSVGLCSWTGRSAVALCGG